MASSVADNGLDDGCVSTRGQAADSEGGSIYRRPGLAGGQATTDIRYDARAVADAGFGDGVGVGASGADPISGPMAVLRAPGNWSARSVQIPPGMVLLS